MLKIERKKEKKKQTSFQKWLMTTFNIWTLETWNAANRFNSELSIFEIVNSICATVECCACHMPCVNKLINNINEHNIVGYALKLTDSMKNREREHIQISNIKI